MKWPGVKAKTLKETGPVTDLDAIVAESVHFRFKGKLHEIKPVTLEEFLKFSNAQAALMDKIKSDDSKLTPDKLVQQYHQVISAVCDSITVEDIKGMEQVQVAALYQLVIDQVTGQVKASDGQKKSRQKIQIYDPVQPSSSPNAPENLVGQ